MVDDFLCGFVVYIDGLWCVRLEVLYLFVVFGSFV